ncbi:S8 family serine peptidase [Exiguobacterium indicum]|nr:S8 family serine peptidase [Exiguobacterium indicum]
MMKRVTILSVLVGSLYGIPSNVSADALSNNNEKVIIFKESVSKESMQQVIKDKTLKVTYQIPELKLIVVQDSHSKLKENKYIESVFSSSSLKPIAREENPSLNEETFSLWEAQWDMKQITGDKLSYSLHQANKGTVVAIIDSGINDEHQDLKDSVVKGSKNLVPVGGYNGTESTELGNKNDYKDRMGHGTGVAGQISANGKLHGVAPGIGIRSYRVFGEKSAKTEWILKAIIEAANDDADVINLSLGEYMLVSGQYKDGTNDLKEYKAYKKAVDYAYKKGSIVVAAAGNAGVNVRNQNDMKELFTLLGNDLDESSKNKK